MITMSLMLTGTNGKSHSNQYIAPSVPQVGEHVILDQTTYTVTNVQHHVTEGTSMYLFVGIVVFASARPEVLQTL
jgi:hypothetical protein